MQSMAVQPSLSSIVQAAAYPSPKFALKPLKAPIFANPNPFSSPSFSQLRKKHRSYSLSVSSPDAISEISLEGTEAIDDAIATDKEGEVKVGVKTMEKPKLVLKFIWMEKNIGVGLEQQIAGHGSVPLSPYYFWPRKDAWEELKVLLESKPWISQKQMIILLNQATDIINLWQQSGGNLA